jgi:hypothetical protein
MSILDNIHKRKAAVKTIVIMLLLFISFFFIGMTYMDPPIEKGIEIVMNDEGAEINYGTSDNGSGTIQPMTNVAPQTNQSASEENDDNVLNQDTEDVPIVKPKSNPKPKETKPKTPTPDKSTSDALNNILGAPSNNSNNSTSDGDGTGKGDKGKIDGNPYATSYYGGGSGSGTGYGLNGRSKTSNQKYTQECEEEGVVVVKIEVDNSGKVINAVPGVKGTTNSAGCLMEPAKRTALSYRFNADAKAPARQIGFVVINFKLGQ